MCRWGYKQFLVSAGALEKQTSEKIAEAAAFISRDVFKQARMRFQEASEHWADKFISVLEPAAQGICIQYQLQGISDGQ